MNDLWEVQKNVNQRGDKTQRFTASCSTFLNLYLVKISAVGGNVQLSHLENSNQTESSRNPACWITTFMSLSQRCDVVLAFQNLKRSEFDKGGDCWTSRTNHSVCLQ